jgi:hypothetical protein
MNRWLDAWRLANAPQRRSFVASVLLMGGVLGSIVWSFIAASMGGRVPALWLVGGPLLCMSVFALLAVVQYHRSFLAAVQEHNPQRWEQCEAARQRHALAHALQTHASIAARVQRRARL